MNTRMPPLCDCCHVLLLNDEEISNDCCYTCASNNAALRAFRAAFDKVSPGHHPDCLRYVRDRLKGRWDHAVSAALSTLAATAVIVFVVPFIIKALLWLWHYSWNLLP